MVYALSRSQPEITLPILVCLQLGSPYTNLTANASDKGEKRWSNFQLHLQWHKNKCTISNIILEARGASCELISDTWGC